LDENFENVEKKNTRKKKDKNNKFGQDDQGQKDLLAAMEEGSDSDDMYLKKGGKKNQ